MADRDLSGYVTLDIETTIHTAYERKASPFAGDNWIVAAAYAKNDGPVIGSYFGADATASRGYLARLLAEERPRYIVGFNIKFDILHLILAPDDYGAYQQWIVDGGQLWDSQLAEYLLDGQRKESHMLSLDEVAPRYGGSLKIDEVKALWAQGIDTHLIPRQLLMDYLVGRTLEDGTEEFGDIGNTRAVFLGQLESAKKQKLVRTIQLNNGALVATIEMERNGLYVDKAKGLEQAKVMRQKQAELEQKLVQYLPDDLPFEFKWSSRKQLSALIFGGRVKYKQLVHQVDDDGHPAYAKMKVTAAFGTIGRQWFTGDETTDWDAAEKEQEEKFERYAGGKKKGQVKTKQIEVPDHTRPKTKMEDFHYAFPGFTAPKKEWETADPGVYSTAEEVIDALGGRGIPFLDDFADLKDLLKDVGTYYIVEELDEETGEVIKAKGMLTLVHPDGLVHPSISMVNTVTGRFAHSKPNSGNLPRSDTSDVKQMFISRWGAEGVIMSSDFTSLEVYVQAILSMDSQLIDDLLAGLDMHIKRLSQAEGKPYEWLVEQIKKLEVKEWVVKRKNIKVFSFQRAYGAGPPKIARFLKLPVEVIEEWVRADEEMYPGIVLFNEKVKQAVSQSRVPEQRFETHPTAKVPLQLGYGVFRSPVSGKKYVFRESPSPDFMVKRGQLQGFSPTELKNYPVQGDGGEWMKAAMWLAVRAFYRYRNLGGLALLVSTVHDALYADSHKDVKRKAGVLLHASMLAASDFMEYWFEHEVPTPVPSETTWGDSMYEEHKFEDPESFHATAENVRMWMRDTFMDGYTPSYMTQD